MKVKEPGASRVAGELEDRDVRACRWATIMVDRSWQCRSEGGSHQRCHWQRGQRSNFGMGARNGDILAENLLEVRPECGGGIGGLGLDSSMRTG
jgi:hypothetical protein